MVNWNYIAGFFDGEGSITHNGKGYRITISQTSEDVLNQIEEFSGVGGVLAVTKRQAHWKQSWVYYIAKQQDVRYFLDKIKDKVVVKRSQTLKTLALLDNYLVTRRIREDKIKDIKRTAKKLRKIGWTYRAIGKKLNIDFGYARRIVLKG